MAASTFFFSTSWGEQRDLMKAFDESRQRAWNLEKMLGLKEVEIAALTEENADQARLIAQQLSKILQLEDDVQSYRNIAFASGAVAFGALLGFLRIARWS
ncbi:hypothetical protein L596_024034 [Steinernema carpocapsae]|uniref:Uncharacterized protein n=1 Tax=Steinernema carpocapsae TaxID=34508 RepID=A0A4U5MFQ5_STECR|nr:hypothetical protein L596_024034 [Steinernema carpocapsae]